jgi:glycosyltransferase involved in cell wall biosynthesis
MNKTTTIIFRIVTSNYCVSTHLRNTLVRIPSNLRVFVLGDNVEIFSNEFSNVVFLDVPLKRNFHFYKDFISFLLISYYILKYRPKVVHSLMTKAGFYSAIISRILNVQVRVHTFTGQIWSNLYGPKRILLKFIDRIICFLNSHCYTDSKSQSKYLFDNGISHRGKILPYFLNGSISGVDLVEFDPIKHIHTSAAIRKEHGIDVSDFVIGYIARKSVSKGCIDMLDIFCDVLSKVDGINVKLLFIGPDESNGLLTKFFESHDNLRSSIIDLGFVRQHHHYISVCSLMCLPSHREGFGSIVIDSAAMGVPTIGYEIPGLVDSISHNYSGVLIPFLDKDSFSARIIELIYNKNTLIEMSKNARLFVADFFDADNVNGEIHNFYIKSK